ncbi:MAG TPA: ChbG/HpnK family deacetylase [Thermodesulfovibrionales bacterium]|nr:ChbG/HpnK family deacetylase [Thermodesulfovibrionales bacterium]
MTRGSLQNNSRYLVIVADDLGSSASVNQAVAEAHDRGILTSASLMTGGEAFEEAIEMARRRSRLSVGLHLTLCDGRAVLPPSQIPGLVDKDGWLEQSPALAGIRYWKGRRELLAQIEAEIKAQFNCIEKAGIRPSHIDGHHHLHLHPLIFEVACREASQRGVTWIRVPKEPLSAVIDLTPTERGAMPYAEWATFRMLGIYDTHLARKYGLRTAHYVYGNSCTGNLDQKHLLSLLENAGGTLNEIFFHPDTATESGKRELDALTSDEVRRTLASLGYILTDYRRLSDCVIGS